MVHVQVIEHNNTYKFSLLVRWWPNNLYGPCSILYQGFNYNFSILKLVPSWYLFICDFILNSSRNDDCENNFFELRCIFPVKITIFPFVLAKITCFEISLYCFFFRKNKSWVENVFLNYYYYETNLVLWLKGKLSIWTESCDFSNEYS